MFINEEEKDNVDEDESEMNNIDIDNHTGNNNDGEEEDVDDQSDFRFCRQLQERG